LETRNQHLENIYFFNDVVRFASFGLIGIASLIALLTLQKKQKETSRSLPRYKNSMMNSKTK